MNCIWDIKLQAARDGFGEADLFFMPAESASPFYEHSFTSVNQRHVENPVIEINPLWRFAYIFEYFLHPDVMHGIAGNNLEFTYYAFDACIHFLLDIDLCHGMTKKEFYIRRVKRDLTEGVYGEEAAEAMGCLSLEAQLAVAEELLEMAKAGFSLHSFCKVLRQVFPSSIAYQSKAHPFEIFVYIPRDEDMQQAKIWKFICDTFLTMDMEARVFWNVHFGILGVDATMEMDRIALF